MILCLYLWPAALRDGGERLALTPSDYKNLGGVPLRRSKACPPPFVNLGQLFPDSLTGPPDCCRGEQVGCIFCQHGAQGENCITQKAVPCTWLVSAGQCPRGGTSVMALGNVTDSWFFRCMRWTEASWLLLPRGSWPRPLDKNKAGCRIFVFRNFQRTSLGRQTTVPGFLSLLLPLMVLFHPHVPMAATALMDSVQVAEGPSGSYPAGFQALVSLQETEHEGRSRASSGKLSSWTFIPRVPGAKKNFGKEKDMI